MRRLIFLLVVQQVGLIEIPSFLAAHQVDPVVHVRLVVEPLAQVPHSSSINTARLKLDDGNERLVQVDDSLVWVARIFDWGAWVSFHSVCL